MKFFNLNKKTIWIFLALILIMLMLGFVKIATTRIGACEGCPPIKQSTLNKINATALNVLYPASNFQHDTSKGISYTLGYRKTDISYDKYGDFSNVTSYIISLLIEIIYLYVLACIVGKIINNLKNPTIIK